MFVLDYADAKKFLDKTQDLLLQNEAANNLILGICFQMQQYPERFKTEPYLATVEDASGVFLVAMLTPPNKLVLQSVRDDYQAGLRLLAEDLKQKNFALPGVIAPSVLAKDFALTWSEVSGNRYKEGLHERLYMLTKVDFPKPIEGHLLQATMDHFELLCKWFADFVQEALPNDRRDGTHEVVKAKIEEGKIFLWEMDDKQVVTMAAVNRRTLHGISIGPVYTPPAQRGKGYASNCVAALSQLQLDKGRKFCCLFTDLANPTSNSVYQNLGYQPVSDFDEYLFE